MPRRLLLCLFLPACVDTGVAAPPPVDQIACEGGTSAKVQIAGMDLDIALVISDAPSMEPYRDAIAAGLEQLAAGLDGYNLDLHVAVIGADGVAAVVIDERDPWFTCGDDESTCRHTSYDGTLADAIIAAAQLPPGAESPPLLQRLDDVSFFRDDAFHAVFVFSAGDDGSNWDPSDYAIRLKHRASLGLAVSLITGSDSPRLQEFASWFPWARSTSIEDPDWSEAFADVSLAGTIIDDWGGLLSVDEVAMSDVAPNEPGLQLDCAVAVRDGAAIPRCRMAGPELPAASNPLPCYWISSRYLPESATAIVETETAVAAEVRCACAP